MMVYGLIAVSGFGLLVFRHPLADVSAKAAAPLGAAFTFLALVTGSLWGRPMWGTYWVWDARLTSVLILFFLYLGLMALRSSLEDEPPRRSSPPCLPSSASTMLPIIKFSVEWWNTLHQPSTDFTSTDDPSMRWPLLVMAVGFTLCVLCDASESDAQRDPAPARQGAADAGRRRPRRLSTGATGRSGVSSWISARTRLSSGFPTAPSQSLSSGSDRLARSDGRKQAADLEALERGGVKRRSASGAWSDDDVGEGQSQLYCALLPVCGLCGRRRVFRLGLRSGDPSLCTVDARRKPVPQTVFPPLEGLETNGKPEPGFSSRRSRQRQE